MSDYGSFDEEEIDAVKDSVETPRRLVQRTLQGGIANVETSAGTASYTPRRLNKGRYEEATHHRLDSEAIKTFVYPTNYSQRDYQFNIIQKALFGNVLVALPTGLGKTFIAAVVMYNWYRWAPDSKIVFVAPTKPLVTQQIEACYQICGIPARETAELSGNITPKLRAAAWEDRRVFFMTPQTLQNDLKTGLVSPKAISCLVVDEAHRATGSYAYTEVIRAMRLETESFRVLALTATPGGKVETVQELVYNLGISQIEIRNEASIDIQQYVYYKEVEIIALDYSPEILSIREKFSEVLQPLLSRLNQASAYYIKDPVNISAFGIMQAQQKFFASPAGKNRKDLFPIFSTLASVAHAMQLLNTHGIKPFLSAMHEFKASAKSGKTRNSIINHERYREMMFEMTKLIATPSFSSHPKLEHLIFNILDHFQMAHEESRQTRVMVFSSLRSSAEEIVNVLKKHSPLVKPQIFVGQAASKGTAGMTQKEQLNAITKFQQGEFNTLVATSVGEEGLDIGEVDLIFLYDTSSSPVRMLQRMGRTGRKREGKIIILCCKGKEELDYARAKDSYKVIQQKITKGMDLRLNEDVRRIIPWNVTPICEKRILEVPKDDNPEYRSLKRAKTVRKEKKKLTLPEGAEAGFVSASSRLKATRKRNSPEAAKMDGDFITLSNLSGRTGLLDAEGFGELEQRFQIVDDIGSSYNSGNANRIPRWSKLSCVGRVSHSTSTRRLVSLIRTTLRLEELEERIRVWRDSRHNEALPRNDCRPWEWDSADNRRASLEIPLVATNTADSTGYRLDDKEKEGDEQEKAGSTRKEQDLEMEGRIRLSQLARDDDDESDTLPDIATLTQSCAQRIHSQSYGNGVAHGSASKGKLPPKHRSLSTKHEMNRGAKKRKIRVLAFEGESDSDEP